MKKLIKITMGTGDTNLVLLHGWGMNSKIWYSVIPFLKPYFKLHLIDLPGFGKNYQYNNMTIDEIINYLYLNIPHKSILLGWSLGGLIACKIALTYPDNIIGIITVCSSPYFIKDNYWPGISPMLLQEFSNNMKTNYLKTIKQFLFIQLGSYISKKKIEYLLKMILSEKQPTVLALESTLNILYNTDLRKLIKKFTIPLLRIYGKFDSIVPHIIKNILDRDWKHTYSVTLEQSAHIPFISQSIQFCKIILEFNSYIKNI
ncbi:Pimeloyl-[acyl-carrier protein] methyl ester esterase [Buchnera aphidicola (Eriosoma lanigerum)]|uniref:pimeloyl-ACP methyl ester esterase BioH n=1 Tax=Buchnera aphidicola TaxID=9 RepID=UPI003464500E